MNRIVKSTRGVITIFVALMMTGILSLGTFVLEAARLQAARTQLGEAAASAASSMLSSYNADLQARYGIFAMDPQRANEISCAEYVQFNSDVSVDAFGSNVARLYQVDKVGMTGVYNLTYPHILKRQLLTISRYMLPPEESEFNMYNASYVLAELQHRCQYVSDWMEEVYHGTQAGSEADVDPKVLAAMAVLDRTFADNKRYDEKHAVTISAESAAFLPSTTKTVESSIPAGDSDMIGALNTDAAEYLGSGAGVLNAGSAGDISQTDVDVNLSIFETLSDYYDLQAQTQGQMVQNVCFGSLPQQYKNLADDVNVALEMLKADIDGNLLLNSYIAMLFSNRRYTAGEYIGPGLESNLSGADDLTFAKASCEYIFGGDRSEINNQAVAYDYVMAIRLICNLYALISSEEAQGITNDYQVATYMAWAYYETCLDMELLTQHNTEVPLQKEKLVLRMEEAETVAAAFADGNVANALESMGYYNATINNFVIEGIDCLDYTDSLNLSLWLVPNSEKLLRVADLIQLEMRYKQRYVDGVPVTFLMSEQNTYCRVTCDASLNTVLPILSIGGSEHSMPGLPLSTLKYAGY